MTGPSGAGVSEKRITYQIGHRSLTIMRRYACEAELFKNNSVAYSGL